MDHANIGATSEDNVFRIEREIFTPDLNGVKGAIVGTDYVTSSEGVLELGIPEFNGTLLQAGWPGSQTTGPGAMEVIDEDETRRIPTADYHDWELQVGRASTAASSSSRWTTRSTSATWRPASATTRWPTRGTSCTAGGTPPT